MEYFNTPETTKKLIMKKKKTELVDELISAHNSYEELREKNIKLKEENERLISAKNHQFLTLFGLLNDYGYCPTSDGQVVRSVREIIEENEKLQEQITNNT